MIPTIKYKYMRILALSIGFVSTVFCAITFYFISKTGSMTWIEPNNMIVSAELYLAIVGTVMMGTFLLEEVCEKKK